jgi:hypothetical protein
VGAIRAPELQVMTTPFEIFASETEGGVLWRGTAATLEEARARVEKLCVTSPGIYLILDRHSGYKTTINRVEAAAGSGISMSL